MVIQAPSQASDNSEAARAFLQTRVAQYWKVMFVFMAVAVAMGAVNPMAKPGMDFFVDLAMAVEAGVFWWLCHRGRRSMRFLKQLDAAVMAFFIGGGTLIGRYVLVGFVRDHSLANAEGALMADAYLSVLGVVGSALMVVVRAALIPSSPRRTMIHAALLGVPVVLIPVLLVPGSHGGLALRPPHSNALPWMPATTASVWVFVIITSTAISRVIYGLRAEVREARRLGQYTLEGKIGEGGMGEVYRARHGMMRRPTALKLLRPDRAGENQLLRFEREVQLTARLTHPNTITIFDYGRTDDGVFYYAMELLDGANLQRIVEVGGPQAEGRVVRILMMACGALIEGHGLGLIHRDIKPANIMLCTQGGERDVVKLLDFGLVKELAVEGDAGVSVANTLTGTPQYMAPESIVAPESVDARTDIYALGAVAYFLLAGGELFDGRSIVEICTQHLHQEPQPLAQRGVVVSAQLETIVRACLEKRPERRPQSAAELQQRLAACVVEPWDAARARSWWTAHQPMLDGHATQAIGDARTVAVDGRSRSAIAVAG